MAITDKSRKILWGRSGNRCAICKNELVMQATHLDNEAVIGDECHIVAREINGPRGVNTLSLDERDDYNNLILLCRNHHKEVDDQPNTFTIELLQEIKREHENWVKTSLDPHISRNNSNTIIYAYRIDAGKQLCSAIISSSALLFDNDILDTQEEVDLVGEFTQNIQDCCDLWSDISQKDKLSAQFEFDIQLRALSEAGFVVYGADKEHNLKSPHIDGIIKITVGYVIILRNTNPLLSRKDAQVETVMQVPDQKESTYTNFVPILVNTSSMRFV
jgi:hypothetical protein